MGISVLIGYQTVIHCQLNHISACMNVSLISANYHTNTYLSRALAALYNERAKLTCMCIYHCTLHLLLF